jgi:hypothetical protein
MALNLAAHRIAAEQAGNRSEHGADYSTLACSSILTPGPAAGRRSQ